MAKVAMDSGSFQSLLDRINQQTSYTEKKVEILYSSRGHFTANQASQILLAFKAPSDKVRAIQILEPRLCRIIRLCKKSVNRLPNQAWRGVYSEFISFEDGKIMAIQILKTVGSYVELTPAGGHQGYAALGGLYTQARPMCTHLYGPLYQQEQMIPGRGKIEIPPEAQPGVVPSVYTGHPLLWTYPLDKSLCCRSWLSRHCPPHCHATRNIPQQAALLQLYRESIFYRIPRG
ncbi:unnamed protein product [Mytilus edulis]|uniref:Uncharacterized protein n=1 Tax=Mytilus edulis TaxID=6550 RepID=A0A8S3SC71_MYTED|nr:unnamed protein product [Mytilus edulis]